MRRRLERAPLPPPPTPSAFKVGAHTLSGAVIETRALDELLGPGWVEEAGPAAGVAATKDRFYFLTETRATRARRGFVAG